MRPVAALPLLVALALLSLAHRAGAQCVDEELKAELVGKRAYRGVVPRKFQKALRHELSGMEGWLAADLADGAPAYGGAYTFHFSEELGLEASYLCSERSFGFLEAVDRSREGVLDIGNTTSPVNQYLGHLVWTLAYGKTRWFGGPIGRFELNLALGGARSTRGGAGTSPGRSGSGSSSPWPTSGRSASTSATRCGACAGPSASRRP